MHSRYTTIRQAKDIDGSLAFCHDRLPFLGEQRGFQGLTVTADREGGLLGFTTHWAAQEHLDASDSAVAGLRHELIGITGGEMTVETFEQTTDAIARPPSPGNPVIVTRVSMDPALVNGQITRFERELMPAIAAQRGFSCLRLMANRHSGICVLGIVWQHEGALKKYMEAVKDEREVAQMQGVRIDEVSSRQILFFNID